MFLVALLRHACVLARIRLTRTAAERGPVLSGERGQDGLVEINRLRMVEHANAHMCPVRSVTYVAGSPSR